MRNGSSNVKPVALDPLLAALIDKLPSSGVPWASADRAAWLELMAMAFHVVYGRDVAPMPSPPPAMPEIARTVPRTGGIPAEPRYYIDKDGFARRDPGAVPIRVGDVPGDEVIFDERSLAHRDLGAIKWADGEWPVEALPSLSFSG